MQPFYSSRWPGFLQASRLMLVVSMLLVIFQLPTHAQGKERPANHPTFYRTIQVDGLSIFYREAGPERCANAFALARASFLIPDVRTPVLSAFRSLSPYRARLPRLRTQ